jgi:hypothetical protein
VAPAGALALALRLVAIAAGLTALAQTATLLVALTELRPAGRLAARGVSRDDLRARGAGAHRRSASASGSSRSACRAGPAGPLAWHALGPGALVLVLSSAVLSHAVARVDNRALLLLLDALISSPPRLDRRPGTPDALRRIPCARAAAAAVGGRRRRPAGAGDQRADGWSGNRQPRPVRDGARLRHERIRGAGRPGWQRSTTGVVVRRFSNLAFASVMALVVAGVLLTWQYVGEWAALWARRTA